MKQLFVICMFIAMMLNSCKKDSDTDKVTTQTIHGQVYNLCTDSGLANVTVYLKIQGPSPSSLQTVSGTNGNFTFNVPVHSSDDYTYELYIPSLSGIGGGPEVGFDGCDGYVIKSNVNQSQLLCVVPHAKNWNIYLPYNAHFTTNDTISLIIQQNTFHKNVPNGVYQLIEINCPLYPPPSNFIDNIGNHCMGWWHTTLDKTKNGIHTIKTDSFYVGWGATVTDTIPWQ